MFVKEFRSIRWKVLTGFGIVLLNVVLFVRTRDYVSQGLPFQYESEVDAFALMYLRDTMFTGLGMSLAVVAVLIGVGTFRQESEDNTILTLLSKPLSRKRLLLIKYGIGAASLLVTALVGALFFWGGGFILGYPMQDFEYLAAVRIAGMLWIASLAVLGVSMLASILVRGVVACLAVSTGLTATILFCGPLIVAATDFFYLVTEIEIFPGAGTYGTEGALLGFLWTRFYLAMYLVPEYSGTEMPFYSIWTLNLPIIASAVVIPLIAALWVFERKEY